MFLTTFLQIVQPIDTLANSANLPVTSSSTQETLSLWALLIKGGYLMIPIVLLSVIAIYVLIERYMIIKGSGKIDANFINNIKDFIYNGNVNSAKALCKNTSSPIARMIEKGISRLGRPVKEIESAMENVGKIEMARLEKHINVLSVIAGIAPMFGFIGTISGVIRIFYNISLANNISIGLIAGGLYEKMITSAAGLVVGVFAFVGYHFLNGMVDRIALQMEKNSVEFIDLIQEPVV